MLALASAALFGLNSASIRRGVLTGSVLHALAITVPLGVPLFALAYVAFGGLQSPSSLSYPAWAWFALAGVVHFTIGRYGNYRATRALGATLSAPMQQISIPVSLALAMYFLDETLTALKLVGILLVLVGPVVATWKPAGVKVAAPSGFQPAYREGVTWGVVGAVAYGVSPLMIVKGLGSDSTLIDGIAGGLISYAAAAIVILSVVLAAGGSSFIKQLDRTAGKLFLLSSVLIFLSQMLRYIALTIAPVSVVVPIQRTSIVFRVVFSWIFNREHEVFGSRLLVGIAMSVIGAGALSYSLYAS
jgi:uncharacterized membrane protein